MKSDLEIKKNYKMSVDKHGLITLEFLIEEDDPESNTRETELILEEMKKITDANPQKTYKILVDITPIGKANYISDRSRELYSNAQIFKKFARVAVVSTSVLLKVAVITIALATRTYENVKFFDNKEEAIEWLK